MAGVADIGWMKSKFKERGERDEKFQLVADMGIRSSHASDREEHLVSRRKRISELITLQDVIQNRRLNVYG